MTGILIWLMAAATTAVSAQPTRTPLVRVVDLNIGESQEVELCDGKKVTVRLAGLHETIDDVRSAVRAVKVQAEVNGQPVTLTCSTYHLPVSIAGVRIDCSITKGYMRNSNHDRWGLVKDARLRLWPAGSPLIAPGTFTYPVKQRWFASDTQMANEPVFVDCGERPSVRKIYYHSGLDFGGVEGMVEVVAATDGLVVSAGKEMLPGHEHAPVRTRYDVIYLLDARGWYYRYSHLQAFEESIKPGRMVKMGQKLGVLGKEGASGGWSHLHFEIMSLQPSGKWGTQQGYAFVWEAYQRQYAPKLVAVARPHHAAWAGQKVVLDGTRSWSSSGRIVRHDWTFTDGSTASGAIVEKTYPKPGTYSEILEVTDAAGRIGYDFAVVQIMDQEHPDRRVPSIHAAYAPTLAVRAGDPVTFKVRTFGTTAGNETWDFGDGSPPVTVQSDGNVKHLNPDGYAITVHVYRKPGDYLVKVERTDQYGIKATAHLYLPVGRRP